MCSTKVEIKRTKSEPEEGRQLNERLTIAGDDRAAEKLTLVVTRNGIEAHIGGDVELSATWQEIDRAREALT
jgi:hypothetical protein